MQLLSPQNFTDYELLDCGDFEKLERFGKYITIRPEPQAVWPRVRPLQDWEKTAHVRFVPRSSSNGDWKKLKTMPDQWEIKYTVGSWQKAVGSKEGVVGSGQGAVGSGQKAVGSTQEAVGSGQTAVDSRQGAVGSGQSAVGSKQEASKKELVFRLGLTSFKHVGVFPEQAVNWDKIYSFFRSRPKSKFLNLFAYTGGASLAARAAGADVTHVDSIKQVVTWANENMQRSQLDNIRWLVDDALKFVKKELRRGNIYQGITLDPPAFGHGPNGEKWQLEDNIAEMMDGVLKLIDPQEHLLILNAYSLGFSALVPENLLSPFAKKNKSELSMGELFLPAQSGVKLPLGVWGSLSKG